MELKRKIIKLIKGVKDPEKIIWIYLYVKKLINDN